LIFDKNIKKDIMKTIRSYLKPISILLMFLITLQSCVVYHSKTASVDEAIQSANRVKVVSTSNDIYKFKNLQNEDEKIYGITKANSSTAKKFSDQETTEIMGSKNVSILLSDTQINEIYLKNKTMSTVLTVGAIVVPVGILVLISINSVNNMSLSWGSEAN